MSDGVVEAVLAGFAELFTDADSSHRVQKHAVDELQELEALSSSMPRR